MSDSITCDQCGRTSARKGLVGWLTVAEPVDAIDMRGFGIPDPFGDFCSTRCLLNHTYAIVDMSERPR